MTVKTLWHRIVVIWKIIKILKAPDCILYNDSILHKKCGQYYFNNDRIKSKNPTMSIFEIKAMLQTMECALVVNLLCPLYSFIQESVPYWVIQT